ncbi:exodeoxyribonuclease V alpha subunit [Paenibacillus sp. 1182]|uniref:AAA family ATPase n=1 Tax=Paenibacillus sp. 1182 TaxID=2806565 RepID=UPI001AE6503B|nr:AAA family ATPase [Paenibacillus sp. 1182]MBP1308837.1 exodeoxyribonuclease V alpha subunit [Paenibacillus sp. 1182]
MGFASWFNKEASFSSNLNSQPDWLESLDVNEEVNCKVVILYRKFYSEDTGFSVYVCEDENGDVFTLSGTFAIELMDEQTYFIKGTVAIYRKEKQVTLKSARLERPTSRKGIISFLKTLKGLNKRSEQLYDLYGEEIVEILMKDPMRIAKEVNGIGKKSVESWSAQLQLLEEDYHVLSELLAWGISMRQAKKLLERFHGQIISMIERNPYMLMNEVKGFGFLRCDEIARQVGYDPKGEERIQQGLLYILKEAMNDGHCFLPREMLLKRARDCLDFKLTAIEMKQLVDRNRGVVEVPYSFGEKTYMIPYSTLYNHWNHYQRESSARGREKYRYRVISFELMEIEQQLLTLQSNMKIVMENDSVYLSYLHQAELKVAEKIIHLMLENQNEFEGVGEDVEHYLETNGLTLEEMQKKAVEEFVSRTGGMYILNGSAGCGKTFTLKVILALMEQQYKKKKKPFRVKIFAPTGKASKVAKKATGRECTTVHRGLAYVRGVGFQYNEDNPLEADCVVIDESSMLDILLTSSLFDAIPEGCKVIFMGDTKQLPSVGAGNVLYDLIECGMIPVITLNVVKRQADHSGIIRNANKIINAEMISSCQDTEDAYVILKHKVDVVHETIIRSIERLMSGNKYTFEDIQILCPQRIGEIGTYVMNWMIQQAFNAEPIGEKVLNRYIKKKLSPSEDPVDIPLYFQTGDKVIHIANNYSMPWYQKDPSGNLVEDSSLMGITNGECGVIEEIRKEKVTNVNQTIMVVRYEDGYVQYTDNFEELDHAYALTVHKSQGSQWPAVIMPVMMENYNMLDNSIFYTGYTRSVDFNCVIGQPEAIAHAIRTFKNRRRFTSLKQRFLAEAS